MSVISSRMSLTFLSRLSSVCRSLVRSHQKLCFTVPAAPLGAEENLTYHEATLRQTFSDLGYDVKSINEGLAVLGSGGPIPFRLEPVITISMDSLNKDNRTFEYIVEKIIKPLLDLWHGNHIHICTQLLLPFDVSVFLFRLVYNL